MSGVSNIWHVTIELLLLLKNTHDQHCHVGQATEARLASLMALELSKNSH